MPSPRFPAILAAMTRRLLGAAVLLAACVTSPTVFEAVNLRPGAQGRRFKTVVVAPLGSNAELRDVFAGSLVGRLKPWTVRAERGADVLSRAHFEDRAGRLVLKTDADAVRRHLSASGFEAVLVVYRHQESPGEHRWTEDPVGDYFSHPPEARPATKPGDPVHIAADLLETATGKVVWSGHSRSVRTEHLVTLADSYAEAVTAELVKSDLIGRR